VAGEPRRVASGHATAPRRRAGPGRHRRTRGGRPCGSETTGGGGAAAV